MILKGRAHIFGDNIDTDVIIPARYLNTIDPKELAMHCMEDIDKSFKDNVRQGDIIVAGYNFGCGSSREHAPIAIKGSGISCVISRSFARIFYRNAINIGLAILECDEIFTETKSGDLLAANLASGEILNEASGKSYRCEPFPEFMQEIITAGGEIEYIKAKIKKGSGLKI